MYAGGCVVCSMYIVSMWNVWLCVVFSLYNVHCVECSIWHAICEVWKMGGIQFIVQVEYSMQESWVQYAGGCLSKLCNAQDYVGGRGGTHAGIGCNGPQPQANMSFTSHDEKKGLKFAQIIFSNAIQCIFSLFRPPSSVCQSSSLTPSPRPAC